MNNPQTSDDEKNKLIKQRKQLLDIFEKHGSENYEIK